MRMSGGHHWLAATLCRHSETSDMDGAYALPAESRERKVILVQTTCRKKMQPACNRVTPTDWPSKLPKFSTTAK